MRNAFAGGHYGFFFHFLNTGSTLAPPANRKERVFLNAAEWDTMTKAFDAEAIASQLHELQADYAFITVGQNSGYYCSPNSVYDREVGKGYCSERDVILDFAEALEKYGIGCYAYTTCFAPGFCPDARKKLQGVPPWNSNRNCGNYADIQAENCGDPRLLHFHKVWAEIHREWSLRWGNRIRGWWVDGCYYPEKMHDFPEEPNGHSFCRALRAGNPESVVAFNPGVSRPHRNYPGSDEDYTAGEINNPDRDILDGRNGIDGLRYHVLSYVGSTWGKLPLRGSGEELAMLTRNITDNGGVVSWDVPFTVHGIDPDVMKTLKDFAECYRNSLNRFPKVTITTEITEEDRPLVRLDSDSPMELSGEWQGKPVKIHSPGVFVPPTPCNGEEMLSLTAGGLSRKFPLFERKKHPLSGKMTEILHEEWGTVSFVRQGENLVFSGSIRESNPIIGPDASPWDGTGLEFFIEASDRTYTQYCLRSDGALFLALPEPAARIEGSAWEKTPEGYRFTMTVPLPDKTRFLLEIYRNIGTPEGKRSAPCFGGKRSRSGVSTEYALVTVQA